MQGYELTRQNEQDKIDRKMDQYNVDRQSYQDRASQRLSQYDLDRERYTDQYKAEADQYQIDRAEYEDYYSKLAGLAGQGYESSQSLNQLGQQSANYQSALQARGGENMGQAIYASGRAQAQGIADTTKIIGDTFTDYFATRPDTARSSGDTDWASLAAGAGVS